MSRASGASKVRIRSVSSPGRVRSASDSTVCPLHRIERMFARLSRIISRVTDSDSERLRAPMEGALHPAEHRAYRELYVGSRQLSIAGDGWRRAGRARPTPTVLERGRERVEQLLAALGPARPSRTGSTAGSRLRASGRGSPTSAARHRPLGRHRDGDALRGARHRARRDAARPPRGAGRGARGRRARRLLPGVGGGHSPRGRGDPRGGDLARRRPRPRRDAARRLDCSAAPRTASAGCFGSVGEAVDRVTGQRAPSPRTATQTTSAEPRRSGVPSTGVEASACRRLGMRPASRAA